MNPVDTIETLKMLATINDDPGRVPVAASFISLVC